MPSTVQPELPSAALLSTKLFVPRAHPEIVHRPRLVARLVEGLSRRLTVISAPPGAGKTTLIAEWHASELGRNTPLAWLTLDERDNDPRRFLAYLVAAIGRLFPDAAFEFESLIQAASAVEIEHTLVLLLNLLNTIEERFVLVVDDYQMIDNQAIHGAMDYLISNEPANMRLIIVSRTDPPLSLARLRVRNQLVEIRTQDLRFTPQEVEVFLRDIAGVDTDLDDAELLTAKTDGWAAGLQLAILSLEPGDSIEERLQEFGGGHRFVADYLLEEVINRQPPRIRDFLHRTSVLDRFTPDLCDYVLEQNESVEHLRFLEQNNLFLIPLDGERTWFRYHPLFQELLRRQISLASPQTCDELLRRASAWFRDAGIGSEAVEYALRAGDTELAARSLDTDDVAIQALDRGELATVLRWLKAIGDDTRYRHPKLNGVVLWSLISNGQIDEIEPYLRDLERFEQEQELNEGDTRTVRGIIAAGRAALAIHHRDFAQTIALSDVALDLLSSEFPIARANTLYSRGFALGLTGNLNGSVEAFHEAIETLGPDGSAPFLMLTRTAYAQARLHQAKLGSSEGVLRALLELVQSRGLGELPYVGFIRICLARVLFERGLLEEALEQAQLGVRLTTRWASGVFELEGHFTVAALRLSIGDRDGALAELQEARELVPMTAPNPFLARLEGLQWRGTGADDTGGITWATAVLTSIPDDRQAIWPWIPAYRLALSMAVDGGTIAVAKQAAHTIQTIADESGWTLVSIQMGVVLARCLWLEGDRSGALAVLRPAIELACDEGVVQPFVEAGGEMPAMLVEFDDPELPGEWRDRVLASLGATPVAKRTANGQGLAMSVGLIEPLSQRELEVLEQIMLGKSNSRIAQELFIAEGTVKRHAHNIYAKLDVSSRTQAIARAAELGMYPGVPSPQ